MKKLNCSNTSSYSELKETLRTITCNSSIETHISIERVISSNYVISEDQKLFLLSSLFIASLGKGIYEPNYILGRIEHLVIAPVTKRKLLNLLNPDKVQLAFHSQKKTGQDSQFLTFKIKSLMTFRA